MKTKIALILLTAVVFTACKKNNVYSELLKAERNLIEAYMQRQGITVVQCDSMPEVWGDNDYWQVPDYDNFYFHLVEPGDTTQMEIEAKETVLLRFKRYTLDEYADTLYNWTTQDSPEPVKFQYMITSDNACTGWQMAVKYMKYPGAQCKIICPSKMGFSEENSSVTPYGYDIKIKIKRY
jgi:hypothetical protein